MPATGSALPVVSIVMPTFNRLEFLRPAIASVLAQTFPDWELLIADDGSHLETRAYLRSLNDPRIRLIWLEHSARPAAVTNVAMRKARGEYVAFLDSDDVWLPHKLEIQLKGLQHHPNRQWSYTAFKLIDAAGQPLASPRSAPSPASGWILEKLLAAEALIAQPTVMVSRSLLERSGLFDESLVMCYDDELWFRLAGQSQIDAVQSPLTLVRRHGQHSGSDVIAWRDRKRVFEKMLRSRDLSGSRATLRRLRAEMAAGLARSQVRAGERLGAVRTVFSSVGYSWRYGQWRRDSVRAIFTAFAPAVVRKLATRHRHSRALSA